jgi:hypothetical protein
MAMVCGGFRNGGYVNICQTMTKQGKNIIVCPCNKINNTQNGQQLPSPIQFFKPNIFKINFRPQL